MAERGGEVLERAVGDDDDVAVAAVTVAQLVAGIATALVALS